MTFPKSIQTAAWSPCSRFIAIAWGGFKATVEILDAMTLGHLTLLEFPLDKLGTTIWLVFSPDTHLLTWCGGEKFITWDLQTGVLVSTILLEQQPHPLYLSKVTYSACGTMFGVLLYGDYNFTIYTYNALSGTHMCSHSVEGKCVGVWTHGKCLQFATQEWRGPITMWEVEFTSTHVPREVGSLPLPDSPDLQNTTLELYPTLSRLSFCINKDVYVWDTQNSKFLLESKGYHYPSFSLDGRFFTCRSDGSELHLWKESSTGYILHQKLRPSTPVSIPHISPDGESIIVVGDLAILLWHTTDSTTSYSTTPTQASLPSGNTFILGFSPDETLAAITRTLGKMITVLDLKSGVPWLIIDTDMRIYGLRVVGSTIAVIGGGKLVTWNLPTGDHTSNSRANINDSVQTTVFHAPFCLPIFSSKSTASVSCDLHRIAIMEVDNDTILTCILHLYDVPTGQWIQSVDTGSVVSPWFSLDGCEIWGVTGWDNVGRWEIIEDSKSSVIKLEYLGSTPSTHPPDGFHWKPSHGYEVTDSGWILHSSGKQLLWLPPHWRSHWSNRVWGGQFLALLHGRLPEVVILELE